MSRRSLPRLLVPIAALCLFATATGRGEASDWMFRRSYFSHSLPPEVAARYPVPESLSAYRPAIISPYPGFSLQGVTRFNNVVIPSGASLDYTLMRSESARQLPW